MYLSDHSKNLISAEEKVAELIKQRDQLRNELSAERARLDWLGKRGPWESWNDAGETGITLRKNVRAAIDAAIKEDAK
jgi:hypothetical protein